jgi:hypothetical protein
MPKKLFQKGNKAACVNKGKPKHTGRTQAICLIDAVLAKPQNQKRVQAALEAHLHKDPIRFLKEVVMQLVPKSTLDRLETDAAQAMALEEKETLVCQVKNCVAAALGNMSHSALVEPVCSAIDKHCIGERDLEIVAEANDAYAD